MALANPSDEWESPKENIWYLEVAWLPRVTGIAQCSDSQCCLH